MKDNYSKLIMLGARWYDPELGRFVSADTIVPNPYDSQSLNRYSYVLNNPLKYTDPTGHDVDCSPWDAQCKNRVKLEKQISYPDKACQGDPICFKAYLTYRELVFSIGRVPTINEVLYMTAQAEYGPYIYSSGASTMGGVGLQRLGQEGLARNFYTQCGRGTAADGACTGSELYRFMTGYEPWFKSGTTATQRAAHLINQLNRNDNRGELEADINQILDYRGVARSQGWIEGKMGNRPWQWFNMLAGPASTGYDPWNYAIASLTISSSNHFWVFTGWQDYYRHHPEQRPAPPR